MKIFVIVRVDGVFVDAGTLNVVVLAFVKNNPIHLYRCKVLDDVGCHVGDVDLAATKLTGRVVIKGKEEFRNLYDGKTDMELAT